MYPDILSEIKKFSNINLETFEYKCEYCTEEVETENMCCCVYMEEELNNFTYNEEIEIFTKTKTFKFEYICLSCYDKEYKSRDIFFMCRVLLHLDSFEKMFEDIFEQYKNNCLTKCQIDNIFIEENNIDEWYKTLICNYSFENYSVFELNFLYENDEKLVDYYPNKLSEKEKKSDFFKIFEIPRVLQF